MSFKQVVISYGQRLVMAIGLAASVVPGAQAADDLGNTTKAVRSSDAAGLVGLGATIDAGLGLRSASFNIAPGERSMALTEVSTRIGAQFLTLPYGIEMGGGLTLAYATMNGAGLGDGLREFSGLSYGPDIALEKRFGRLASFGSLGYRMGRYKGRGTVNWRSEEPYPALWLYPRGAVNEEHNKSFDSSGAHVSIGASYDVRQHIAAVLALDLGFETMSSDTRVIDGRYEMLNRGKGDFGSQSLGLGARVTL